MRVCEGCHGNFGCAQKHPVSVIHCGDPCGVCSKAVTAMDCFAPIANEISSYNGAMAVFTLSMRAKFLENLKVKGGWQEIGYDYALKRLLHEAGELAVELMTFVKGPATLRGIIDEAADVANFALFIGNRALDEDSRNRAIEKRTSDILAQVAAEKTT